MQRFQHIAYVQEVPMSQGGGVRALTRIQLLLTNYCQTLSSMIAWMTLCPSPPHVSFESGHAKLGLI
jgi:hypothetical protein